jgi:hypothetical protein
MSEETSLKELVFGIRSLISPDGTVSVLEDDDEIEVAEIFF